MEVDYYRGKRVSRAEREDARANPEFDKTQHVNVDVESATERREMKRVNPITTRLDKLLDQIKNGVQKYTRGRLTSLKNGGPKKNIVEVDFGEQVQIPSLDQSQIRTSMQEYISQNPIIGQYVDAFVIHIELDGVTLHITVDV